MVAHVPSTTHFDPKYFSRPNEFRPEAYINSEGKFVAPKEGFVPFGLGRRVCLGESLARMELFIYIITLVQNLNFAVPPGKTLD
ncbi:UNVERIFIED_CONTAM: hypothetical protein GTU68_004456 [Idotea baltica]|nr:hypothetical protein [Idotea baltica]